MHRRCISRKNIRQDATTITALYDVTVISPESRTVPYMAKICLASFVQDYLLLSLAYPTYLLLYAMNSAINEWWHAMWLVSLVLIVITCLWLCNCNFLWFSGGSDSRVVKSLDCSARGPGFESRCRRKVLGSDGIICKYLTLWVCPEFVMRACSLFWFVLIELRHWGEPSAVLWLLKIPELNLVSCLVLYTWFVFYCISAVLCDRCWFCCSVMTATAINEHYYYYYYYYY